MATAEIGPRFGSAAQLATYSGLSIKTIRRLVDAGKVRGHKVGRRLLIPYAELDRHILRFDDHDPRRPVMPAAPEATPSHRSVDARGRALPLAADAARARAEEGIRALDDLDGMGDEDEQRGTLDALLTALDEDRPAHRKLFP